MELDIVREIAVLSACLQDFEKPVSREVLERATTIAVGIIAAAPERDHSRVVGLVNSVLVPYDICIAD